MDFGGRNGLELGAEKTKAIIFTHKRLKIESLPHLRMGARDLDYSDMVRYLGISVDSKLTFGPHIREKAKKAIRLLYQFRTSLGQLWGPSLFLMRWVLTGIVCPKVMYGAIVWANKATNYKEHVDSVQRLGLLALTHVHHSTPTARLEAALDVMPLDLYVQCVAVQAVLRVRSRNQSSWGGIGCSHLRGHLLWGDKTLKGRGN